MDATRESVRIAPWYWGQRPVLVTYALAGVHIDNAIRNARVLARQAAVAIDRGETVSPAVRRRWTGWPRRCSSSVRCSREETRPLIRAGIVEAVRIASQARTDEGLFTAPMVAQVRLMSSDLLQATDLSVEEAASMIRGVDSA